jgi:predicted transposase YdaD
MKKMKKAGNNTNRKYKDGMFRALFKNPDKFRELYNAVTGTNYGEDTVMKETTLADALYMGEKNDVSFLIDGTIVVFMEHQSTVSPNIAARMLVYAGQTYKAMLDPKKIYGAAPIKLPRSEFYVFYNGKNKFPKKKTVRLSDLFEPAKNTKNKKTRFALDLVVDIYNINTTASPEILRKSETLSQYETFVELVEKYAGTAGRDAAVERAVKECVKRGILADFLKIHGRRVVQMLDAVLTPKEIREIRIEHAIHNAKLAASHEGELIGRRKGMRKGRAEGMKKGMAEGMEKGMEKVFALLEKGISVEEAKKILRQKPSTRKRKI